MTDENLLHQRNALLRRNVWQANESVVTRALREDKLPEVFIHRHKYASFIRRPFQEHPVAGIGTPFPRFDHIMPLLPQPLRQPAARAPVNEKLHFPATRTASRES